MQTAIQDFWPFYINNKNRYATQTPKQTRLIYKHTTAMVYKIAKMFKH